MISVTLFTSFFVVISSKCEDAEFPKFRILAPQLVCPKDEHSPIEKPDTTIITILTTAELNMKWTVRWHPLSAPSQRFTLLLWRYVRALEAKLNGPQSEPFVYVIHDNELLYGVNYIFNVTATANGQISEIKSFYVNNTFGEQTLEALDGLTDKLSVLVIGGQVTFADIEYVLEAVVTTCVPFYDYYVMNVANEYVEAKNGRCHQWIHVTNFEVACIEETVSVISDPGINKLFMWKVQSSELKESLNVSTVGSRLEIPPYSIQAGVLYDVTCCIMKDTTNEVMTQIEVPFDVGYRGLDVYLSADQLIVGIDQGFTVESTVINHDYSNLPLTFHWRCVSNGMECEFFNDVHDSNLIISSGFIAPGQYEIILIVSVLRQSSEAKITIIAVESILPMIQVRPTPRILNVDTQITLVANASNIIPMCTLRWYFASKDHINESSNKSSDEYQHGTPIGDAVTVYSLDENFLYELTDFSNDTEWREVTAEMKSSAGRARFVVECNCSLALGCTTKALAYADVHFELNNGPKISDVTVSPSSGTALETIFRVSSRPAADPDGPLRYTYHCDIGNNNTLLLGSYSEHSAMETFLPYFADGTDVWIKVCDIRGACSTSYRKTVQLKKGEARSVDTLKAEVNSYIKRCELIAMQRIAIMTLVTYTNAGQTEALTVFTTFLLDSVPTLAQRCISQYNEQYLEFLNYLILFGLDTRL